MLRQPVLGEKHAHDIVERVPVHRIPGVPLAAHDLLEFVPVHILGDGHHVRTRTHHVDGTFVVKVEHTGQHGGVGLVECPVRACLHHEQAEFLRAVHLAAFRHRLDAERAQHAIGGAIQEPDERRHGLGEDHERTHDQPTHTLRLGERDGLGRQLSQHDVQEGDDHEGHRDAGPGVRRARAGRDSHQVQGLADQNRHRRLTDPAQRQGGQ